MKEINAINTKQQRQFFGRNTRTQKSRTALLKARVNWKYGFIAFLGFYNVKDWNTVRSKEKAVVSLASDMSVQDPEFGAIIMEIKVAKINAPPY